MSVHGGDERGKGIKNGKEGAIQCIGKAHV